MNLNSIIVPAFSVEQFTDKKVFLSKISYKELRRIARFTYRESSSFIAYDADFEPIEKGDEHSRGDYYQRLVNDGRTKGIYEFLLEEINNRVNGDSVPLGTFPTSMILSLGVDESSESAREHFDAVIQSEKDKSEAPGVFIEPTENGISTLYIPDAHKALIVDGQHRIAGMDLLLDHARRDDIKVGRDRLNKKYPNLFAKDVIRELNNFEFVCTILLGFDMWEQGRVFADVNFNQKPVNKSLYYDIFGSYPDPNKNEIFLAHNLAMYLNNSDKSVLKDRFKMLGRGEGLFSQAFFVEAILPFFRDGNIWSDIPYDFLNDGKKHRILPKFFSAYFEAIKGVFDDFWPKEDENTARTYRGILLKTTGMGALIKLIPDVYAEISESIDPEEAEPEMIRKSVVKVFNRVQEDGEKYFSMESEYAGSGSQGMLGKLYRQIKADLGY